MNSATSSLRPRSVPSIMYFLRPVGGQATKPASVIQSWVLADAN
jgi:hypothetical protein